MITATLPTSKSNDAPTPLASSAARTPFWTRHKTLINFWLDVALLVVFCVQSWLLAVIAVIFPRGEPQWTIWGATASDWLNGLFTTYCVFAVGIVLHVMLHWTWICGTVATRILGRKASKDDGSQTLIGVGFLIFLLHVVGAAVLAARVCLVNPLH